MIAAFIRHLMIATLNVLLHAPLAYQASTLHADLAPGMGLQDLSLVSQLSLLLLLALPYAALAPFGIRWNPPRARLGEYDC